MAISTRKRLIKTLNDSATNVANGVVGGAKSVAAVLPKSKPSKLRKLRGAVVNRKVLIPAIALAGVGALGYGAYKLVTSDDHLFGHFPGLETDAPAGSAASNEVPVERRLEAEAADDKEAGKPAEDDFHSPSGSDD